MNWLAKVIKHPYDENKWMLSFDLVEEMGSAYGHGRGNGKSKQSVYSWIKKQKRTEEHTVSAEPVSLERPSPQETSAQDSVETQPIETEEWPEGDPDEGWERVDWTRVSDEEIIADTIGAPVRSMIDAFSGGDLESPSLLRKQRELQGKIARWGFMTIDRLVTWWGRGVTQDQSYELVRSARDYDLLEGTTTDVMDYYNLSIPLNPLAIWGITVGTAYIPPLSDIRSRADPKRRRKLNWRRFIPFLRKRPDWNGDEHENADVGTDFPTE